jgi:nitrilase
VSTSRSIDLLEHRRTPSDEPFVVAAAQLGGPWLDVKARLDRAIQAAELAASHGARVIAFPECYLSGYPYWLSRTNGATFGDPLQKKAYRYYVQSAIEVGGPEIARLVQLAADLEITVIMGLTERAQGTTYCSLLTISRAGIIGHHRKLIPTYDERLVWGYGDGYGLRSHLVGRARIGSLNCWENWMPQARQAMYATGEDVHFGVWPGSVKLTADITRFTAMEGRVFGVAVGGLLRRDEVPADFPLAEQLLADLDEMPFDGGTAIAGPDGSWVVEPISGREGVVVAELDLGRVAEERFTFDPTGHYSRPDILSTTVDRKRRQAVEMVEEEAFL